MIYAYKTQDIASCKTLKKNALQSIKYQLSARTDT